jgi:voltage-gated potassium channel
MEKAGADAVISPSFIGGMRMVSEMIRPAVVSFLDMMLRGREDVLRFEEVAIKKGSQLAGKDIGEFKALNKTEALLVAVKDGQTGEYRFNPSEKTNIRENDSLVIIGSPAMLESLEKDLF